MEAALIEGVVALETYRLARLEVHAYVTPAPAAQHAAVVPVDFQEGLHHRIHVGVYADPKLVLAYARLLAAQSGQHFLVRVHLHFLDHFLELEYVGRACCSRVRERDVEAALRPRVHIHPYQYILQGTAYVHRSAAEHAPVIAVIVLQRTVDRLEVIAVYVYVQPYVLEMVPIDAAREPSLALLHILERNVVEMYSAAVDLESSVGDVRHHGVIHLQQTVVDARSVAAEFQIVKRSLRPDFSGNAAVDFGEHPFQQALEPGDVLPVQFSFRLYPLVCRVPSGVQLEAASRVQLVAQTQVEAIELLVPQTLGEYAAQIGPGQRSGVHEEIRSNAPAVPAAAHRHLTGHRSFYPERTLADERIGYAEVEAFQGYVKRVRRVFGETSVYAYVLVAGSQFHSVEGYIAAVDHYARRHHVPFGRIEIEAGRQQPYVQAEHIFGVARHFAPGNEFALGDQRTLVLEAQAHAHHSVIGVEAQVVVLQSDAGRVQLLEGQVARKYVVAIVHREVYLFDILFFERNPSRLQRRFAQAVVAQVQAERGILVYIEARLEEGAYIARVREFEAYVVAAAHVLIHALPEQGRQFPPQSVFVQGRDELGDRPGAVVARLREAGTEIDAVAAVQRMGSETEVAYVISLAVALEQHVAYVYVSQHVPVRGAVEVGVNPQTRRRGLPLVQVHGVEVGVAYVRVELVNAVPGLRRKGEHALEYEIEGRVPADDPTVEAVLGHRSCRSYVVVFVSVEHQLVHHQGIYPQGRSLFLVQTGAESRPEGTVPEEFPAAHRSQVQILGLHCAFEAPGLIP